MAVNTSITLRLSILLLVLTAAAAAGEGCSLRRRLFPLIGLSPPAWPPPSSSRRLLQYVHASANGALYQCNPGALALTPSLCVFEPSAQFSDPIFVGPSLLPNDLDTIDPDPAKRAVLDKLGFQLLPEPRPFFDGVHMDALQTPLQGNDLMWARYAELIIPLRDLIMYDAATIADEAPATTTWDKYTKAFADCYIKHQPTIGEQGQTVYSVDGIYQVIIDAAGVDTHNAVLQFIEEGSIELACLMTNSEDTLGTPFSVPTICADMASRVNILQTEIADCWIPAYQAFYGVTPVTVGGEVPITSPTTGCAAGFTGTGCSTNINECADSPCLNGATCTDGIASVACACAPGFTGPTCVVNINDCSSSPCVNAGTCVDGNGAFTCACVSGFTGSLCEADINECNQVPSPCQNGGTCTNTVGGFVCTCVSGEFIGNTCETSLASVCASAPCQNQGTCSALTLSSFSCSCVGGFTGQLCQTNINECASSPCGAFGTCTDQVNGFLCSCELGFTGTLCDVNINECSTQPCLNGGTCVDGIGSFVCECSTFFSGAVCEVSPCADLPCQNGGTCVVASNTTYVCSCAAGFTGTDCAVNTNECSSSPCQNSGSCTDTVNGFECACVSGYAGITCETDINECASVPCLNAGICIDQINGVSCTCLASFTGTFCEFSVQSVCASAPCQHGGTCTELSSTAYTCACVNDFSGANCETTVNDCATSPCANGGTCIDMVGTFACTCDAAFTGIRCETALASVCSSQPCSHGGTCTALSASTFSCACVAGFTGALCEADINECLSSPCQNAATCVDLLDAYSCTCDTDFTGVNCEASINDCAQSPCLNGGTCVDGVGFFSCSCALEFTGQTCAGSIASQLPDGDYVFSAASSWREANNFCVSQQGNRRLCTVAQLCPTGLPHLGAQVGDPSVSNGEVWAPVGDDPDQWASIGDTNMVEICRKWSVLRPSSTPFWAQSGGLSSSRFKCCGLPTVPVTTAPIAAFEYAQDRRAPAAAGNVSPMLVTFYDKSFNNAFSVTWNFGDNSPVEVVAAGLAVTHNFADPGVYRVVQTVTNSAGSTTVTKSVAVYGCARLTIDIAGDSKCVENSWTLGSINNGILDFGAIETCNAVDVLSPATESHSYCLFPGRHDFVMRDSAADGMCCDAGIGGFQLTGAWLTPVSDQRFRVYQAGAFSVDFTTFNVSSIQPSISTFEGCAVTSSRGAMCLECLDPVNASPVGSRCVCNPSAPDSNALDGHLDLSCVATVLVDTPSNVINTVSPNAVVAGRDVTVQLVDVGSNAVPSVRVGDKFFFATDCVAAASNPSAISWSTITSVVGQGSDVLAAAGVSGSLAPGVYHVCFRSSASGFTATAVSQSTATVTIMDCNAYCVRVLSGQCSGEFTSVSQCEQRCAFFRTDGTVGDDTGNTLQCRLTRLLEAEAVASATLPAERCMDVAALANTGSCRDASVSCASLCSNLVASPCAAVVSTNYDGCLLQCTSTYRNAGDIGIIEGNTIHCRSSFLSLASLPAIDLYCLETGGAVSLSCRDPTPNDVVDALSSTIVVQGASDSVSLRDIAGDAVPTLSVGDTFFFAHGGCGDGSAPSVGLQAISEVRIVSGSTTLEVTAAVQSLEEGEYVVCFRSATRADEYVEQDGVVLHVVTCSSFCNSLAPGGICSNAFGSTQECESRCAFWRQDGLNGVLSQNTFQCRVASLENAAATPDGPTLFCPSVAALASRGLCRDSLPLSCAGFCINVQASPCADAAAPSTVDCEQLCATYRTNGEDDESSGNTIQCRDHFLAQASVPNLSACDEVRGSSIACVDALPPASTPTTTVDRLEPAVIEAGVARSIDLVDVGGDASPALTPADQFFFSLLPCASNPSPIWQPVVGVPAVVGDDIHITVSLEGMSLGQYRLCYRSSSASPAGVQQGSLLLDVQPALTPAHLIDALTPSHIVLGRSAVVRMLDAGGDADPSLRIGDTFFFSDSDCSIVPIDVLTVASLAVDPNNGDIFTTVTLGDTLTAQSYVLCYRSSVGSPDYEVQSSVSLLVGDCAGICAQFVATDTSAQLCASQLFLSSVEICTERCAFWRQDGASDAVRGNTLQCRISYFERAMDAAQVAVAAGGSVHVTTATFCEAVNALSNQRACSDDVTCANHCANVMISPCAAYFAGGEAECLLRCGAYRTDGLATDATGDSLQCRETYLSLASTPAVVVNCPEVAQDLACRDITQADTIDQVVPDAVVYGHTGSVTLVDVDGNARIPVAAGDFFFFVPASSALGCDVPSPPWRAVPAVRTDATDGVSRSFSVTLGALARGEYILCYRSESAIDEGVAQVAASLVVLDCSSYCGALLKNESIGGCGASLSGFADEASCVNHCSFLRQDGANGVTSGNTLQCRIAHVGADADRSAWCPQTSLPANRGACMDSVFECETHCRNVDSSPCAFPPNGTTCLVQCETLNYRATGDFGTDRGNSIQCRDTFFSRASDVTFPDAIALSCPQVRDPAYPCADGVFPPEISHLSVGEPTDTNMVLRIVLSEAAEVFYSIVESTNVAASTAAVPSFPADLVLCVEDAATCSNDVFDKGHFSVPVGDEEFVYVLPNLLSSTQYTIFVAARDIRGRLNRGVNATEGATQSVLLLLGGGGGDPHFFDGYGQRFEFDGEQGKVYNLFTSERVHVNARFMAIGAPDNGDEDTVEVLMRPDDKTTPMTVMGELGIMLGSDKKHKLYIGADGRAQLNGVVLERPAPPSTEVGCVNAADARKRWRSTTATIPWPTSANASAVATVQWDRRENLELSVYWSDVRHQVHYGAVVTAPPFVFEAMVVSTPSLPGLAFLDVQAFRLRRSLVRSNDSEAHGIIGQVLSKEHVVSTDADVAVIKKCVRVDTTDFVISEEDLFGTVCKFCKFGG